MITNAEIGKRIRIFRKKRGVSQAKLGQLLNYSSHVPVVYMESGRSNFNLVELEKIADVLGVPLADLVPELWSKTKPDSLSVALRANSLLSVDEKDQILAYYYSKLEQKQRNIELATGGRSLRTPQGARALARRHLSYLGVDKPPVDLRHALFYWRIDFDETDLDENIAGFLIRSTQLTLICVNINDTLFRRRMTTAHELGHFHLQTTELHITADRFGKEDNIEEELAFQYAHELLMPSDWLRDNHERWQQNPVYIAHECQVSPIACEIWARKLGLALPLEPELRERHDAILDRWAEGKEKVRRGISVESREEKKK